MLPIDTVPKKMKLGNFALMFAKIALLHFSKYLSFLLSVVFFKTFEIFRICLYANMNRKNNTPNNSNNSQRNKKLRKYRHTPPP